MYRNDGVVMFDGKKIVFKFGFKKRGIFNNISFLNKAFHGEIWKVVTSFSSRNIILDL